MEIKASIFIDNVTTIEDASEKIGISVATAWRWIASHDLIAVKIGDRTVIPTSEIDRLKEKQRIEKAIEDIRKGTPTTPESTMAPLASVADSGGESSKK